MYRVMHYTVFIMIAFVTTALETEMRDIEKRELTPERELLAAPQIRSNLANGASAAQASADKIKGAIGEDENANGAVPGTVVPLTNESTVLARTLINSVKDEVSWGKITLPPYTNITLVPQIVSVFSNVLVYIVRDDRAYYMTKYKTLGLKLARAMDLYALTEANAFLKTNWLNVTVYMDIMIEKVSKALPGPLIDEVASLWLQMDALRNITLLDTRKDIQSLDQITAEEKENYFKAVRSFFRGSCELTFNISNVTILQKLDMIDFAGKYVFNNGPQPESWFVQLIDASKDRTLDDPSLFQQIALLKYADTNAINTGVGYELLGSAVDSIFEQLQSNLATSAGYKVEDLALLFTANLDPNIETFSLVSLKLCRPEMRIRFCLLVPLLQQISVLAAEKLTAWNSSIPMELRGAEASMKRTKYLELLLRRSQMQQLNYELHKLFEEMDDEVYKSADALTVKMQTTSHNDLKSRMLALMSKVLYTSMKMKNEASSSVMGYELQFNNTIGTMNVVMKEVRVDLDKYDKRLQGVANAALGAAIAKVLIGTVGIALRIAMTVMNPFSWFDPGSYSDVARSLNQLRKDIEGREGIKELKKRYFEDLAPRFKQLMQDLTNALPKIEAMRTLIKPLLANDTLTMEAVKPIANEFLRQYADYTNPVTPTTVATLQNVFTGFQEELCRIAAQYGQQIEECRALKMDVMRFMKLNRVVSLSNEALSHVAELARAGVRTVSANTFTASVENATAEMREYFDNNTEKEAKESRAYSYQIEFFLRRYRYVRAISTIQLFVAAAQSAQATVRTCAYFTYLNAGVVIPPCLSISQSVEAPFNVQNVISYRFNAMPEPISRIAYIPTRPSKHSDAFLDLEELMRGQSSVSVSIPQDVAWLRRYNWIPADFDITKTVVFLQKFALILPPATDSRQPSRRNQNAVRIRMQSSMSSNLGPAVERSQYVIPVRTYDFAYTEVKRQESFAFNDLDDSPESSSIVRPGAGNCQNVLENPYRRCKPTLLDICGLNYGSVDTIAVEDSEDVPLPSLFSTFHIAADRSNGEESGGKRLLYDGVQASAPLAVYVTLIFHDVTPLKEKLANAVKLSGAAEAAASGDPATQPPVVPATQTAPTTPSTPGSVAAVPTDAAALPANNQRTRTLQSNLRENNNAARCCAAGSYMANWRSSTCMDCPIGHTSHMGGIFCLPPIRVRGRVPRTNYP